MSAKPAEMGQPIPPMQSLYLGELGRDGTADDSFMVLAEISRLPPSRRGQPRWANRFHPGSYLGELGQDGTQGSTLIGQDQSNASISARSAEMGQPIPPKQSLYLGELSRDGTQGWPRSTNSKHEWRNTYQTNKISLGRVSISAELAEMGPKVGQDQPIPSMNGEI